MNHLLERCYLGGWDEATCQRGALPLLEFIKQDDSSNLKKSLKLGSLGYTSRDAKRVIRGGNWWNNDLGFRLALSPVAHRNVGGLPLNRCLSCTLGLGSRDKNAFLKEKRSSVGREGPKTLLRTFLKETGMDNIANTSHIEEIEGHFFELVYVEGGEFMMGSGEDDPDAYDDETPQHKKTVKPFLMGRQLVSQKLWSLIMGNEPSFFKGEDRPVEQVSWDECQEFLQNLNKRTRKAYRLPSEAEWEFAARGGIYAGEGLYAGSRVLEEVGHFEGNAHQESQNCGEKHPNELGLYDMSGNVDEWCQDHWRDGYRTAGSDSSPWQSGDRGAERVVRGGIWWINARRCRAAYRSHDWPENRDFGLGFRLALSPVVGA